MRSPFILVLGGFFFGIAGYWVGTFTARHRATFVESDGPSKNSSSVAPLEGLIPSPTNRPVDRPPINNSSEELRLVANWLSVRKNIDDPRFRILLRHAIGSGDQKLWITLRQFSQGFDNEERSKLVHQAILATKPYLSSDYISRLAGWNDASPAVGQLLMQVTNIHDLDALTRQINGDTNQKVALEVVSTTPIGESWVNTADFVAKQKVSDAEYSRLIDMTVSGWSKSNSDEAFIWLGEHSNDPRLDAARLTFAATVAKKNAQQGAAAVSAIGDQKSRAIAEGLLSLL